MSEGRNECSGVRHIVLKLFGATPKKTSISYTSKTRGRKEKQQILNFVEKVTTRHKTREGNRGTFSRNQAFIFKEQG